MGIQVAQINRISTYRYDQKCTYTDFLEQFNTVFDAQTDRQRERQVKGRLKGGILDILDQTNPNPTSPNIDEKRYNS